MPAPKGHAPYNKNGEGGVPKVYTQEFVDIQANELEVWMKKKENIFIEDFCFERGYSYKRFNEWLKENIRLADTYELFQMKQKSVLMKGGLSKKFSHPMCALLLGHTHGIIAKTEQKISGDAANPLACLFQEISGTSKDLVNED